MLTKRRIIKCVSLLVLLIFTHEQIGWVQEGSPVWARPSSIQKSSSSAGIFENVDIPYDVGEVSDAHINGGDEVIINIQDAHSSLSAQHSIANILTRLVSDYDVNLIALEGAEGFVDTSILRTFPDKEVRDRTAEFLMREGKLSAGEFFSVTKSGKAIGLYGVEDDALYNKNLDSFRRVVSEQADYAHQIRELDEELESLADEIYSEKLKKFEKKSSLHRSGEISFSDYWQNIKELSPGTIIDIRELESIASLVEAIELEKQIDFNKANIQRKKLIDVLSDEIERQDMETLVLRSLLFKQGKISPAAYHGMLIDLADEYGVDTAGYKDLLLYTEYISIYHNIDIVLLYSELELLEDSIRSKLYRSTDEEELYKWKYVLSLLSKLYSVELSNRDYRALSAKIKECTSSDCADFIRKSCLKYGVPMKGNYDIPMIFSGIADAIDFYHVAEERNLAMINNTLKQMRADGVHAAALVTGGFHTGGLTDLMKSNNMSYLVVVPKFESGKERPYIAVLTNRKKSYEKLIETGKYNIAVKAYFQDMNEQKFITAAIYAFSDVVARGGDWTNLASLWLLEYSKEYNRLRLDSEDKVEGSLAPEEVKKILNELAIERLDDKIIVQRTIDENATYFRLSPGDDGVLGSPRELPSSRGPILMERARKERAVVPAIPVTKPKEFPGVDLALERLKMDMGTYDILRGTPVSYDEVSDKDLEELIVNDLKRRTGADLFQYMDTDKRIRPAIERYIIAFRRSPGALIDTEAKKERKAAVKDGAVQRELDVSGLTLNSALKYVSGVLGGFSLVSAWAVLYFSIAGVSNSQPVFLFLSVFALTFFVYRRLAALREDIVEVLEAGGNYKKITEDGREKWYPDIITKGGRRLLPYYRLRTSHQRMLENYYNIYKYSGSKLASIFIMGFWPSLGRISGPSEFELAKSLVDTYDWLPREAGHRLTGDKRLLKYKFNPVVDVVPLNGLVTSKVIFEVGRAEYKAKMRKADEAKRRGELTEDEKELKEKHLEADKWPSILRSVAGRLSKAEITWRINEQTRLQAFIDSQMGLDLSADENIEHSVRNCPLCRVLKEEPNIGLNITGEEYLVAVQTSPFAKGHMLLISENPDPQKLTLQKVQAIAKFCRNMGEGYEAIFNGFDKNRPSKAHKHYHWQVFEKASGLWSNYEAGFLETHKVPNESDEYVETRILDNWIVPGKMVRGGNLLKVAEAVMENVEALEEKDLIPSVNMRYLDGEYVFVIFSGLSEDKTIMKDIDDESEMGVGAAERSGYVIADTQKVFNAISRNPEVLSNFLNINTAPVVMLKKKPKHITTRVARYVVEKTQSLTGISFSGEEESPPEALEERSPFAEPAWSKTPVYFASVGMTTATISALLFNGNISNIILAAVATLSLAYAFGFGVIKHFVLRAVREGRLEDALYAERSKEDLQRRAGAMFEALRVSLLKKTKRPLASGTDIVIVTDASPESDTQALGEDYAAYLPGRDRLFLSEKMARAPDWVLSSLLSHELAHTITKGEFLANLFMFRNIFTTLRLKSYAEFYPEGDIMNPVAELITSSNDKSVLDDLEKYSSSGKPQEKFDLALEDDILKHPEVLRRLLTSPRSIFIAKNVYAENEYTYRFSIEPGNPLKVDLGEEFEVIGRTQPDARDADLYGTRMAPAYSDMSKAAPGGWYFIVKPNGLLWYSFSRELEPRERDSYNKYVKGIDHNTPLEDVKAVLDEYDAKVDFDPEMIGRYLDRTTISVPAWRQKLMAASAAFLLMISTMFFVTMGGLSTSTMAGEKGEAQTELSVKVDTFKEVPEKGVRTIRPEVKTPSEKSFSDISSSVGIFKEFLLTQFPDTLEVTRPGEGKWTANERDRQRFFSGLYDEAEARQRVQAVNKWLEDNWQEIEPTLPKYVRITKKGEARPVVQQKALFLVLALDPGLYEALEAREASIYTSTIVPAHGTTTGSRWGGRWGTPIIKIHEDLAANPAGFAIALQHEAVHAGELSTGRLAWWWQKTTNGDFMEIFGTDLPANEVRAYTREAEFERKLFNLIPTDGKAFFADRWELGIKYMAQKNAFALDGLMVLFFNIFIFSGVIAALRFFVRGRRFYSKFTAKVEELRSEMGTDANTGKDNIDLLLERIIYEGDAPRRGSWSEQRGYEELINALAVAGMDREAVSKRLVKYARRYVGADRKFKDSPVDEINKRLREEEYEHPERGMKKIHPGSLNVEGMLKARKNFEQNAKGEWDFKRGNGIALVAGYGFEGEINTGLSKIFSDLRDLEPDPAKLYLADTDSIHLTIAGMLANTQEVSYSDELEITRERMFKQIRDIASKYGPIGVEFYYKDLTITPAGEIVALGYVTNENLFDMREEFDKRGISFRKTGIVHATIGRVFDENLSRGQFERLKAYIEGIRQIPDTEGNPALLGRVEVDRLDVWDQRGATKKLRFRKTHFPVRLYNLPFLSRIVEWYRNITDAKRRDKVKQLQAGLEEDRGEVNHGVLLFKMGISEKLRKDAVEYLESKGFEVARVGKSDGPVGMDRVLVRWGKGSGLGYGVKGVARTGINVDEAESALEDNDGARFMEWFREVDRKYGDRPAVKELKYSIDCLNRSTETVIVRYRGPRSKLIKDFGVEDDPDYAPDKLEEIPFQDIVKNVVVGSTSNVYTANKPSLRGYIISRALSSEGEMSELYAKGMEMLPRDDYSEKDLKEAKEIWPNENFDDPQNAKRLVAKKLVGLIANGVHCPKKEDELAKEIDEYLVGTNAFREFLFDEIPALYDTRIEDAQLSDAVGISMLSEVMRESGGRPLGIRKVQDLVLGEGNTLKSTFKIKVCRLQGNVIGYALVETILDSEGRPIRANIDQIAVDGEYRKRNVARALMANVINSGLVNGVNDFEFDALNPAMEYVGRNFGFKPGETRDVGLGRSAVHFSLKGVEGNKHGVRVGLPSSILEKIHKRFRNRFETDKYEEYLAKNKARLIQIIDRYGRDVDGVVVTDDVLLAMLEREVFLESSRLMRRLPLWRVATSRRFKAQPAVPGEHLKGVSEHGRVMGQTRAAEEEFLLTELREGLENDPGIYNHAVMLFKVGIPEPLRLEILEYLRSKGFDVARAGRIDGEINMSTVLKRWGKGSGLGYSVSDIKRAGLGVDVTAAEEALETNDGKKFEEWFREVERQHGDNEYVKALKFSMEGLNNSIEGVIVRYNGPREKLYKDFNGDNVPKVPYENLEFMYFQDIFKNLVVGDTHAGRAIPESIRGGFIKPALREGGLLEDLYKRGLELVPEEDIALYANGVHCPKGEKEEDKEKSELEEEIDDYLLGPKRVGEGPAAIMPLKEMIAPKMPLREYAIKIAPWVEEIIFYLAPAILAHYIFGLESVWSVILAVGVRAFFLYLHKGARIHAPPAGADIRELTPEQILSMAGSRYAELRKHITADWNYVQLIARAMGVKEGSDEWQDLKAITFAHDIGGILGYNPDEEVEEEVLKALEAAGVSAYGKTNEELLSILSKKGIKLSDKALGFIGYADHPARSLRILDEAGIEIPSDVRLIIKKHMQVPTNEEAKVWSQRQKLLYSIFTMADVFETGNNYYKQIEGHYKRKDKKESERKFETKEKTLDFLRNKKFKDVDYVEPGLSKVENLVRSGAFDEAIKYSQTPFYGIELGKSWVKRFATPVAVSLAGIIVTALPPVFNIMGDAVVSPWGTMILSFLLMGAAHTLANYIAFQVGADPATIGGEAEEVPIPQDVKLGNTDFFAVWDKMIKGQRPNIPSLYRDQRKRLKAAQELHGFGYVDFLSNREKVRMQVRYLFQDLSDSDRQMVLEATRRLADKMKLRNWSVKNFDRLYGLRSLARNLFVIVSDRGDIPERAKRIVRGIAYALGLLTLLMEYTMSRSRMLEDEKVVAQYQQDILDADFINKTEGDPDKNEQRFLADITSFEEKFEDSVRSALEGKDLQKIEPEGSTMMAFTSGELPFVVKVIKEGAKTASGRQVDFSRDLLPKVSLARRVLGGLAANTLDIRELDVTVDGEEDVFHQAIIQTKVKPLYQKIIELNSVADASSSSEVKRIMKMWWDLQVRMWRRGVVDSGIKIWANYGYDEDADRVVIYDFNNIHTDTGKFWSLEEGKNIFDAYSPMNERKLREIGPDINAARAYQEAMEELKIKDLVSIKGPEEIEVEVWPSREDLASEEFFIPLNDPFMVDSAEFARLVPALERVLDEGLLGDEERMTDESLESMLSFLERGLRWFHAEREYGLAYGAHPSAGALRRSIAVSMEEVEPKPLKELPFPVTTQNAPDLTRQMLERVHDVFHAGLSQDIGISIDSIKDISIENVEFLVGRDIVSLQINTDKGPVSYSLILYKRGYNLDAEISDPYERIASRLMGLYKNFRLKEYEDALKEIGISPEVIVGHVKDTFREALIDQDLIYFDQGSDAVVYSNKDKTVVVKELKEIDPEKMKTIKAAMATVGWHESEIDSIEGYKTAYDQLGHLFIRFHIVEDFKIRVENEDGSIEEKVLKRAVIQKRVPIFFKEKFGGRQCIGVLADAISAGNMETSKMLIDEFLVSIRMMMNRGVLDWDIKTENYGYDPSTGHIGSLDAGKFKPGGQAEEPDAETFYSRMKETRGMIRDWAKLKLGTEKAEELAEYFEQKTAQIFRDGGFTLDIADPKVEVTFNTEDLEAKTVSSENVMRLPLEKGPFYNDKGEEVDLTGMMERIITIEHGAGISFPTLTLFDKEGRRLSSLDNNMVLTDSEGERVEIPLFKVDSVDANTVRVAFLEPFDASEGEYRVEVKGRSSLRQLERESGDDFFEVLRDWARGSTEDALPVSYTGTENMKDAAIRSLAADLKRGLGSDDPQTARRVLEGLERVFAEKGFSEIQEESNISAKLAKPHISSNAYYIGTDSGVYTGVKVKELGYLPDAHEVLMAPAPKYKGEELSSVEIDDISGDIVKALIHFYDHEQNVYDALAKAFSLNEELDVVDKLAIEKEFGKISKQDAEKEIDLLRDLFGIEDASGIKGKLMRGFDRLREKRRYPFSVTLNNFIVRKNADGSFSVELESFGGLIAKGREIEVVEHMNKYLEIPYDIIFKSILEEMGQRRGAIFMEKLYFQAEDGSEARNRSRKKLSELYSSEVSGYLAGWMDQEGMFEEAIGEDVVVIGVNKKIYEGLTDETKSILDASSNIRLILLSSSDASVMLESFNESKDRSYPGAMITALVDIEPDSEAALEADNLIRDFISDVNGKIFSLTRPEIMSLNEGNISQMENLDQTLKDISEKYVGRIRSLNLTEKSIFDIRAENIFKMHRRDYSRTAANYLERLRDGRTKRYKRHYLVTAVNEAMDLKLLAESIAERREAMEITGEMPDPIQDIVVLKNDELAKDLDEVLKTTGLGRYLSSDRIIIVEEGEAINPGGILNRITEMFDKRPALRNVAIANKSGVINIDHNDPGSEFSSETKESMLMIDMPEGLVSQLYKLTLEIMANSDNEPNIPIDGSLKKLSGYNFFTFLPKMDRIDLDGEVRAYDRYVQEVLIRA